MILIKNHKNRIFIFILIIYSLYDGYFKNKTLNYYLQFGRYYQKLIFGIKFLHLMKIDYEIANHRNCLYSLH